MHPRKSSARLIEEWDRLLQCASSTSCVCAFVSASALDLYGVISCYMSLSSVFLFYYCMSAWWPAEWMNFNKYVKTIIVCDLQEAHSRCTQVIIIRHRAHTECVCSISEIIEYEELRGKTTCYLSVSWGRVWMLLGRSALFFFLIKKS